MLKVRGISLLLMFLPLFASASYGENLYGEEGIPRILGGGTVAAPGWMVALGSADGRYVIRPWNFSCGGVLIDKQWVLTAAHCVQEKLLDDLEVAIGLNDVGTGMRFAKTKIDQVIMHEAYQRQVLGNLGRKLGGTDYDLALLHLESPSKNTPITMGSEEDAVERRQLTAWGYGYDGQTVQPGQDLPHRGLKQLAMKSAGVVDLWYKRSIHTTNLFAGGVMGEDVCPGDSGSPLTDANGRLQGIASFSSDPCGQKGVPAAFSFVLQPELAAWIQQRPTDISISNHQLVSLEQNEPRWVGVNLFNPTTESIDIDLANIDADTREAPQNECPPTLAPGTSCQVKVLVGNVTPEQPYTQSHLKVTVIKKNGSSQRLEATVVGKLKGTTPMITPPPASTPTAGSDSSGGGSTGAGALMALLSLLCIRRLSPWSVAQESPHKALRPAPETRT